MRSAVALPPPSARRHTRRRLARASRGARELRPRGRASPLSAEAALPTTRSGRRRSPAGWSSACRAPTPSSTDASRRSPAASCRTSPASTPSSRRPTSRTCAAAASTTSPCSAPRSTAAPPTAPAPASARRASARSPRCTARTASSWASTCVRRSPSPTSATSSRSPATSRRRSTRSRKAVSHVYASGAFPVVLGGDHSIGYPTTRGVAQHLDGGNLGIIHFDRHVDTQETDLDERMHTTPWFHATDLPNVPGEEPRPDRDRRLAGAAAGGEGRPRARDDGHDRHRLRRDGHRERGRAGAGRRLGRRRCRLAQSFDVDCLDAAFVPGTGWPEPGGFLPARGPQVHPDRSPTPARWPGSRSSSARRPTTTPRSPR